MLEALSAACVCGWAAAAGSGLEQQMRGLQEEEPCVHAIKEHIIVQPTMKPVLRSLAIKSTTYSYLQLLTAFT